MTIGDLIKNKDYDYIEYRCTAPADLTETDIFFGICKSENGKLIALDYDSYDESEEVLRWEEWSNLEKGIKNGLTVVVEAEWM